MKRIAIIAGLFAFSGVFADVTAWTNKDGKVIQAEQIGFDAQAKTAKLKTADGKTYDVPVATLSTNDAERAAKWKAPLKFPIPEKLTAGLFSLKLWDCADLLGRSELMDEDLEREVFNVEGADDLYQFINPAYSDWSIKCVFDQDSKCAEFNLEFSYEEDDFNKVKIPRAEFTAWMSAVAPDGNWKANGSDHWVNDKTKDTAEITDSNLGVGPGAGGNHNKHISVLCVRSAGRQAWLDYRAKQLSVH